MSFKNRVRNPNNIFIILRKFQIHQILIRKNPPKNIKRPNQSLATSNLPNNILQFNIIPNKKHLLPHQNPIIKHHNLLLITRQKLNQTHLINKTSAINVLKIQFNSINLKASINRISHLILKRFFKPFL